MAIVQKTMTVEVAVPARDIVAKIPGVHKFPFKPLPADRADPMRERLECEKQAEAQQKSQKKILKRPRAPAGGNGETPHHVSALRSNPETRPMTAEMVNDLPGEEDIFYQEFPRVVAPVHGHPMACLPDTGADINVIRNDVAERLQLPMWGTKVRTANGATMRFAGCILRAPIKINDPTRFFAVNELSQKRILGMPFTARVGLQMEHCPSGKASCRFWSKNDSTSVRFVASKMPGIRLDA